jgi:hypothetical protein
MMTSDGFPAGEWVMPMLRLCGQLVVLALAPAFTAAPPAGRHDRYGDPLPAGRWLAWVRCVGILVTNALIA